MKKIFFLCLFSNAFFSFSQWSPLNSGTSNFLPQTFFLNKDTGYVVQDNGVLRRTTNGGTNWNLIYSGTPKVYDVSFTSFLNGNAIGDHLLAKTVDGGLTWTAQYTNANMFFWKIFFPSVNIGYATALDNVTDSSLIFKTIDGGTSWNVIYSALLPTYFNTLHFANQDTGLVTIESSPLIGKTYDGGLSWQYDSMQTAFDMMTGVYLNQGGTGYVVGTGGLVFKTTNWGNAWTDVSDPGNSLPLYAACFRSPDTGYVVGGDGFSSGVILKTTDGGVLWTNTPGLVQSFFSLVFPTSSVGYTCGTNGTILKYDGTVGIDENENAQALFITYPNPTSGTFIVRTKSAAKKISIFNSLGEEIFRRENFPSANATIDLSAEAKGIYFVKVVLDGKVGVRKIVLM